MAINAGFVKIVTSALCRPNLRDPGRSGCCESGSSERACRQHTRLSDASATKKTVFYARNFTAQKSIGLNGSSRKAWRTRIKSHCGMILGYLGRSMSNARKSDDRTGSVRGFQLLCN